jgi:hypothetical protein
MVVEESGDLIPEPPQLALGVIGPVTVRIGEQSWRLTEEGSEGVVGPPDLRGLFER